MWDTDVHTKHKGLLKRLRLVTSAWALSSIPVWQITYQCVVLFNDFPAAITSVPDTASNNPVHTIYLRQRRCRQRTGICRLYYTRGHRRNILLLSRLVFSLFLQAILLVWARPLIRTRRLVLYNTTGWNHHANQIWCLCAIAMQIQHELAPSFTKGDIYIPFSKTCPVLSCTWHYLNNRSKCSRASRELSEYYLERLRWRWWRQAMTSWTNNSVTNACISSWRRTFHDEKD